LSHLYQARTAAVCSRFKALRFPFTPK
jgi:hypothetical protein